MSFIRPEAAQALLRWREVLVGLCVMAGGYWWFFASFGIWRWMALAVVLAGAAIAWEGVRRARFAPGTGGAGVVEVDERQITYFGPTEGGAVSIDALTRVTIVTNDKGPMVDDVFWVFEDEDGQILSVPTTAEGAEALFDAISVLPGVAYDTLLTAMTSMDNARFVVWERAHQRLH